MYTNKQCVHVETVCFRRGGYLHLLPLLIRSRIKTRAILAAFSTLQRAY
jgi:hypothetical protein